MGRFDRLRPQRHGVHRTASPLAVTRDPDLDDHAADDDSDAPDHSTLARPIQVLLAIGIDGQGPLTSAVQLAEAARSRTLTAEEAVASVERTTIVGGASVGFVTGVGAFSTMAVALPVNVVEFHVQAARMVGAIATLRGHDVGDPQVRRAVLRTLVGTQRDSPLVETVTATRGGAATWRLLRSLPSGVLLVGSKGIAFRLLHLMADLLFGRYGRRAPFLGGVVVAAVDGWNMRRIAAHARNEFPAVDPGQAPGGAPPGPSNDTGQAPGGDLA